MIHLHNRAFWAIAIACAGALFGFGTGRLSAWLVPVGSPLAAQYGSESKPSVPLQPAGVAKKATPPPEITATTEKADAASPGVTSRALSPTEQTATTEPAAPEMKLVNPDGAQKQKRPAPTQVSAGMGDDVRTLTAGSEEGIERCRAKYRSFDPVDGTYKPYGQDTRIRCPHLR